MKEQSAPKCLDFSSDHFSFTEADAFRILPAALETESFAEQNRP